MEGNLPCKYAFRRNDELVKLRYKDLSKFTEDNIPYYKVTLTFRKTNQNDQTKTTEYMLPHNSEEPMICPYSALEEWTKFLASQSTIGLQPDDYLFPRLTNNEIRWGLEMGTGEINTLFSKFASSSRHQEF